MSRLLIRGGRALLPNGNLHRPPVTDILIEDGWIRAVGPAGTIEDGGAEILDASGLLVSPGFVNAHYHSHDVLLRGMFEQLPLEVWGLYSFPSSYPRRSDNEVSVRTLLGAAENLLSGVTTVQDMVSIVGPDRGHVTAMRAAYRQSGLRAVVALQYGDRAAVDTVPFWREDLPSDMQAQLSPAIDARPMQLFVEALLEETDERLVWALGPSAPQRCSVPLLAWTERLSRQRNLRVFTHVYETRSQAVLARRDYVHERSSLIAFLERLGLLTDRLTIAHGVWIDEDEISMLGRAGASLSCNPVSNLKLLNGFSPIRRYADAGINIGLGCDNCSGSDSQDIFATMKAFALHWANAGPAGDTGAAERAFVAATEGGAAALGLGEEIGAIRSGYRADLVLLRLDDPAFAPLNSAVRQLVYAATPRAVETVLVQGQVVVRGGKVASMDLTRAQAAADEIQADICSCNAEITARFKDLVPELLRVHRRIACEPLPMDRMRLG